MKKSKEEQLRKLNEGLEQIRPEYLDAAAHPPKAAATPRHSAARRGILIAAAAVLLVVLLFAGYVFNGYVSRRFGDPVSAGPENSKEAAAASPSATNPAPDTTAAALESETAFADPGQAETTPETRALDTAPETTSRAEQRTYKNGTFTVLLGSAESAYTPENMFAQELTGNVLNDATYRRNCMVEDTLGIRLAALAVQVPAKRLKQDVLAAAVDYDTVLESGEELMTLALQGMLGDWYEVSEKSSRDPEFRTNRGYEICGRLVLANNDVNTAGLRGVNFLYFNPRLIEKYSLDNPYILVDENRWTLDAFLTLSLGASSPENGTAGLFGMDSSAFFAGSGLSCLRWEGNTVKLTLSEETGKLNGITKKLKNAENESLAALQRSAWNLPADLGGREGQGVKNGLAVFAENGALFWQGDVKTGMDIRGTGFPEVGILPNPKYDGDQAAYCHAANPKELIWAFPDSVYMDKERLCSVMDAWTAASAATVMQDYLTLVAGTKEGPARENAETVKNTVVYDETFLLLPAVENYLQEGYDAGDMENFPSRAARDKTLSLQEKTVNAKLKDPE